MCEFRSLFNSALMAIVVCLLGELEFQQCRKQSGWRSAEFYQCLGDLVYAFNLSPSAMFL